MTNSEHICSELGKLYFFKELEKSDLIYFNDEDNQENELADTILRVGNYIFAIQIKEMDDTSRDIQKWLDKKVYRNAKNQTKETCKQIFENIRFKNKENADILDDINNCIIIPIIIFDIKEKKIKYQKIYETKDGQLLIHIFDLKDFKYLCEKIICPMEMVRYIDERKNYVSSPMITLEKDDQIMIAKTESEKAMLELYCKKYDLDKIEIIKLLKFNTYLTLFEDHCINNKNNYKIMIKKMSQFYAGKIDCFIERLDLIIEKAFKNEWYCNSYIIDKQQCVLFMSVPKDKLDMGYINFISNLFMYKFGIRNVLTIICHATTKDNYELDFALVEYDDIDEKIFEEALNKEYLNFWNTKLNKKC